MDTFVYRIRTDGNRFICEVQRDKEVVWQRVCFQSGRVLSASNSSASMGEYYETEEELTKVIESVLGSSARRVREWRTV